MAGAARIAEFFASVGFQADEKSLKSALTKVAAFGASVSVLAGGVFASLVGIAKAEADIAAQADKLGTSSERLEELRYVAEQTGSSADKLTAALESIASKNPRIKDTAAAFDLVSDRMRGMSELQRKLYAQRLGIDPTLIPMMTDDVAGLREEFRAMYAVAGTDAKAAAEESKGFLNELARLKTLSGMLAKAVGLAFIGKIRRDIENLRRVIMENFGKIQRILQIVIGFVMRVAGAIGAFVYRIIKWAGQLVGWFDSLDDGQKKLVIGVGLLIAAWKMLNLAFLTTSLGMLITGLAGIVAPLAVAKYLKDANRIPERDFCIIAFRMEECPEFGRAYAGSLALTGKLQPFELELPHRDTGMLLKDVLLERGVDVERIASGEPLMDLSNVQLTPIP